MLKFCTQMMLNVQQNTLKLELELELDLNVK